MPYRGLHELATRKALARGAQAWLDALPGLVESLEREWAIEVGKPLSGGTEAFVAEAVRGDGTLCVLKLAIARPDDTQPDALRHEITALRLARGEGCAEMLRADEARGAILLERLGPPLQREGLPAAQQLEILCATLARMWRPAAGYSLPTGREKAAWLVDFIAGIWEELGRPCSERAVEYALLCARRRMAAHDDERAVLVHGDAHALNALRARDGWKLVDPDGLLAEAEYDLGVLMREAPHEMLAGDPRARSHALAARTGANETAIWEWGAVERVSSGLLCTKLGIQPEGAQMLQVAERVAAEG